MLGIPFRVQVPQVEERADGPPEEMTVENALRKARAVLGATVLAADTLVALDGQVYGKPADAEEAERVLRRLSGRTHDVWTGIALRTGGDELHAAARTSVRFRPLDDPWIAWYVATEEWRGRAGGYAIQGRGAALVQGIEGDYWNVVGLPVPELVRLAPGLVMGGP